MHTNMSARTITFTARVRTCIRAIRAPISVWHIATALALVVSLGCFSPAVAASPAGVFTEIQKGIDTRNAALVEKHLDLDAVITRSLAAALKDPELMRLAAEYPPLAVMLALGGAESAAFNTFMTAEIRKFVEYGVTSGAFAGKPDPASGRFTGLLGPLFKGGAKDAKTFRNAKLVRRDGDKAVVAVDLHDASNGETYALRMVLERRPTGWTAVEIANVAELAGRAKAKDGAKQ